MSSLPTISLKVGDRYFRVDGKPKLVFTRNLAAWQKEQFVQQLDWMTFDSSWWQDYAGTRAVRVSLDSWAMRWWAKELGESAYGYDNQGELVREWSEHWKEFFLWAEERTIYVMPVFTGWYNWNPEYPTSWEQNPLNAANGGCAHKGAEVFGVGLARKKWMDWLESVVRDWNSFASIFAWEIYSEINLTKDVTSQAALTFVNEAQRRIRNVDQTRPVTVSLAGVHPDWVYGAQWGDVYKKSRVDFIQIHPYPKPWEDLGRRVLDEMRVMGDYGKPVMIGESGLNGKDPDSALGVGMLANAHLGLEHAVWAGVMSGAMNARGFWCEDGYAIYSKTLGADFLQRYAEIERTAARFMRDVDMTDLVPVAEGDFYTSPEVTGAALSNGKNLVIGWVRDAGCEPPNWSLRKISGAQISIHVPGRASTEYWEVVKYDTTDGVSPIWPYRIQIQPDSESTLHISLPDFVNDVAFTIRLCGKGLQTKPAGGELQRDVPHDFFYRGKPITVEPPDERAGGTNGPIHPPRE